MKRRSARSTSKLFVLMRRDGKFFNRGRWVTTLREAAKYDEELAGDLFRNMSSVKEMLSVSEVRKSGLSRAPKKSPKRAGRRRRRRTA